MKFYDPVINDGLIIAGLATGAIAATGLFRLTFCLDGFGFCFGFYRWLFFPVIGHIKPGTLENNGYRGKNSLCGRFTTGTGGTGAFTETLS